jgi:hypothetical protein
MRHPGKRASDLPDCLSAVQLTLVSVNEEVLNLRGKHESLSDQIVTLKEECNTSQVERTMLQDALHTEEMKVVTLTHQKGALRELIQAAVILVLGYLGIRRDAGKEVEKLIEATASDALMYSKLPELNRCELRTAVGAASPKNAVLPCSPECSGVGHKCPLIVYPANTPGLLLLSGVKAVAGAQSSKTSMHRMYGCQIIVLLCSSRSAA